MFKVNDKVILSREGLKDYKAYVIAKKGYYGLVVRIQNGFDPILRLSWFNAKNQKIPGWQHINLYAKNCQLLKKTKPYNHPLTPIFAKKMPHFGPLKTKKTRKTRKKGVDTQIFS